MYDLDPAEVVEFVAEWLDSWAGWQEQFELLREAITTLPLTSARGSAAPASRVSSRISNHHQQLIRTLHEKFLSKRGRVMRAVGKYSGRDIDDYLHQIDTSLAKLKKILSQENLKLSDQVQIEAEVENIQTVNELISKHFIDPLPVQIEKDTLPEVTLQAQEWLDIYQVWRIQLREYRRLIQELPNTQKPLIGNNLTLQRRADYLGLASLIEFESENFSKKTRDLYAGVVLQTDIPNQYEKVTQVLETLRSECTVLSEHLRSLAETEGEDTEALLGKANNLKAATDQLLEYIAGPFKKWQCEHLPKKPEIDLSTDSERVRLKDKGVDPVALIVLVIMMFDQWLEHIEQLSQFFDEATLALRYSEKSLETEMDGREYYTLLQTEFVQKASRNAWNSLGMAYVKAHENGLLEGVENKQEINRLLHEIDRYLDTLDKQITELLTAEEPMGSVPQVKQTIARLVEVTQHTRISVIKDLRRYFVTNVLSAAEKDILDQEGSEGVESQLQSLMKELSELTAQFNEDRENESLGEELLQKQLRYTQLYTRYLYFYQTGKIESHV